MQKKWFNDEGLNRALFKWLRVMKLTVFFLLATLIHLSASVYSQQTKLSISLKDATVRDVLKTVENQSEFFFLYKNENIDVNRTVNVDVKEKSVEYLLDQIFKGTSISYEVVNRQIVLIDKGQGNSFPQSQQQQKSVKGKVTDSSGATLPGVSVVVKGTTTGVITDNNGTYFLSNIPDNAILQFSFVGMKMQEIAVGNQASVNVVLDDESIGLEEVIAIGYGIQKKKLVTGATVQIKGSDILKQNTANALGALQSRAPGVDITQTSGQPGSAYKVTIRGVGTTGNSSPLYVVDGIVRGGINDLDPSSIASMDVLKDAASAAIYGARAANGVILITTKQGLESKPTLTYDGYIGFSNVYKPMKTLDAQQYTQIMNEAAANSGLNPFNYASLVPNWDSFSNGSNRGVDWLGEALVHNAPTQRHSINLRGGSSTAIYATGFSNFSEEGTIGNPVSPKYNRSTFYINSEVNVIKNSQNRKLLKIGENLSYAYYTQNGINVGNQTSSNVRNLLNENPFQPNAKNTDGTYITAIPWEPSGANPIARMILTQGMNNNKYHSVNGNAYVVIEPIKGLTLRSTFGINVGANMNNRFTPTYNLGTQTTSTLDVTNQSMGMGLGWSFENTAKYDFKITDNMFDVLVGQSAEASGGQLGASLAGSNINNIFASFNSLEYAYLDNSKAIDPSKTTLSGSPYSEIKLKSYFARANYNYKEKYLITAIFRADGSSNFAPGKQWGYFPSISGGWVLTSESFMETQQKWLEFFKLRVSWGQNGNQSITPFQYLSTVASDADGNYAFDRGVQKTLSSGAYPNILPSPDISWETSEQTNIGFDSRFLRSRLGLAFDWYSKVTRDWLVQTPILASYGTGASFINGGDVENRGVEVALNWKDKAGEFTYDVNLNLACNKNKVLNIANSEGIIHGAANVLSNNTPEVYRAQVGYPIGYFWGFKTTGVFQNENDILNYVNSKGEMLQPTAKPGDVKFVDFNGDGKFISGDEDKTMIGNPNPELTMGLSFSMGYKGFDLSMNSTGVFGNSVIQNFRTFGLPQQNYPIDILGRWTEEGTSDRLPRMMYSPHPNFMNISDLYVQDASYLRITNFTFGYDFKKIWKNAPLQQLRAYVAVNNLATFTKYTGMDPNVGYGEESWAKGVDIGFYPAPRTAMFGVSIVY